MARPSENRSQRRRSALLQAAAAVFLEKGYDGASMDDVAARAEVSKPTVYKYFSDKETLFATIVEDTTGPIVGLVRVVVETMAADIDVQAGLTTLARQFISALMQPKLLQLRRLVIANADRFPELGRRWYAHGFERVLSSLADTFSNLSDRQLLRVDDPLLAANHFVGLLLWIPVNRAMFTGEYHSSPKELERYAAAAVSTFLGGYGPIGTAVRGPVRSRKLKQS